MKVSTEIKRPEQQENDETVQEADFAVDLAKTKKFTTDGFFCKFGGHAFVSIFTSMQEIDGSVTQPQRS